MPATAEKAKKTGPSAAKKSIIQVPASADNGALTPHELEQEFSSQVSEIGTAAEEAYKSVSSKIQDFLQTFRNSLHQKHERDENVLSDHKIHTASQQTQIEWLQSVIKERDLLIVNIGDERTQAKRELELQVSLLQLEIQERKLRNTEERLASAEPQVRKLREENTTLTARFKRDLDTFLTESASKVDSLTSCINIQEQGKQELLRIQTENKGAIQRLKDGNSSLNCKLAEATDQLKQQESNIDILQKECHSLQTKLQDLQKSNDSNRLKWDTDRASLRLDLDNASARAVHFEQRLEGLRKEMDETKLQYDETKLKLDTEVSRSTRQSKLAEAAEGKAKKSTSELQSLKDQHRKLSTETTQSQQREQLRSSASLFALKRRKIAVEESLQETQQKLEQASAQRQEDDKKIKEMSEQLDAARTHLSAKEADLKATLGLADELKSSYEVALKEMDELKSSYALPLKELEDMFSSLGSPEPIDPITGPLLVPYGVTRMETGPISVHISNTSPDVQRQFDHYKIVASLEIQSLREQVERNDQPSMEHDHASKRLKELEERCIKVERQLRDAVDENIELRGKIASCEEVEQALMATRDILKGVEGRLRDAVVENSDLRRKVHKW
ncbi:hypothetical protein FRC20_003409 [Serendipita sp. 405]|nr:hypothetical protein FRC20_003409 [Serendipita sp. 405]